MSIKFLFFKSAVCFLSVFSFANLAGQNNWNALGSHGMNDVIFVAKEFDGKLYAGGKFTTADLYPTKHIAILDTDIFNHSYKWQQISSIDGIVYDLLVYNNELYASGAFSTTDNNTTIAHNIARASSIGWQAVGNNGTNGAIYAMAEYNGDIYVGGSFTGAGTTPAKNIAKWNGTSWSNVGTGILASPSSGVRKLFVYGGELYAAGNFSVAGGVPVKNVAKWDGTSWSAVADFGPTTFGNATINSFAEFNGSLYAAGNFSVVDNNPVNGIARYDGMSWTDADAGLSSLTNAMALGIYNNQLYASGIAGATTPYISISKWNGSAWSNFATLTQGNAYSLSAFNGSLIAAGFFDSVNNVPCGNVAAYKTPEYVGIGENADNKNTSVFPNPFSESAVLSSKENLSGSEITLYNTSGQVVKYFNKAEGNSLSVSRDDLPAGIYLLRQTRGGKVISTSKLVIASE